MHETVMTQAGLERAMDELERLKTVGRREIAERIQRVLATDANVEESPDYLDAREEQALLELRIARLEDRLGAATIAGPDETNGVIDVGERVRLRDLDTGRRVEYELVGAFEADPAAGRISVESPLGRALLGLRKGDVAVVHAPKGELRFKILRIELPMVV